jgi:hypothetical protein
MRDSCSLRWHGVDNGDSLYVFKGTVSRSWYWVAWSSAIMVAKLIMSK